MTKTEAQSTYDIVCNALEEAGLTVVDGEVENEIIVTKFDGRSFVLKIFDNGGDE